MRRPGVAPWASLSSAFGQRQAPARLGALILVLVVCGVHLGVCVAPTSAAEVGPARSKAVAPFYTKAPVATGSISPRNSSGATASSVATTKSVAAPDKTLLEPPSDPQCQLKSSESKVDERQKLEQEQQCYRNAAKTVGARLRQLQKAAGKSVADKALLKPLVEPDCELKSRADLDERQKLDYQSQCYRQAEMIAHQQLRQLQKSFSNSSRSGNRSRRPERDAPGN